MPNERPPEPIYTERTVNDISETAWDVIVVGAGPAGATAARLAAVSGATVLLLDKAKFPRYKTCGGGLTGISRSYLPQEVSRTFQRKVAEVQFSHRMTGARQRAQRNPLLMMVERDTFDQANVDAALAAGCTFRDGVNVRSIEETPDGVAVLTDNGALTSSVVVGADGAGGRVGRYVGVQIEQVDLGLEVEITMPLGQGWESKFLLDWGPRRGTYAWVFPKTSTLTVGVIEAKGHPEETRRYLERWTAHLGLQNAEVTRSGGHLTQWRAKGAAVRRGRVILAGETAGLLEPWTREGISFALRSGTWAGTAAARFAAGHALALAEYERQIEEQLEPEIAAGKLMLRLFERRPGLIHFLTGSTHLGARYFFRICRGDTTLGRTLRISGTRRLITALGR